MTTLKLSRRNTVGSSASIFLITILCVTNLSAELIGVTAAIAGCLFLYFLINGIKRNEFYFIFIFSLIYSAISLRYSLSILYPVLAVIMASRLRKISSFDYLLSVYFISIIIVSKSFFELDDYIYFDRNHLGLIAALIFLINPAQNTSHLKLGKIILILAALTLLSRTLFLFIALFVGTYSLRNLRISSQVPGIWYPLSFLTVATALSILFSFSIDLDIFDSSVRDETARLVEVNDASNRSRILALINYYNYLSSDYVSFLMPTSLDAYLFFYDAGTAPHNTLFALTFNYGFPLAMIYLLYIGHAMKRLRVSNYFFVIFIPYYLILGGVIFGPAVILFFIAGRGFK